ncbi:NADH-ubiquinone oxidoreductase subunit NDUFA12 family protein [Rickettsiales bacterium LUAb2]
MKLLLSIYLIFFGKKVGLDQYKNKYYLVTNKNGTEKRFVLYKGINEASKVPPEWEAWLRFSTNSSILNINKNFKSKAYLPNLTGTAFAYSYVRNENTKKLKSHSTWQGKK